MTARAIARAVLALFYGAAGVLHLAQPRPFLSIMPPWVPAPEAIVALTGVAELAGAIGILLPRWRRAAAVGLALYALAVWPANLHHALLDAARPDGGLGPVYHAIRLPMQLPLIWLSLWVGGLIDWPLRWRRRD